VTVGSDSDRLDRLEASLLSAMISMAPAGIHLGCRIIRADDEKRLLPEERSAVTTRDRDARRASGAARHLARGLLENLGHKGIAIGRERSGRPLWPAGVVGSLAHDGAVAVAAVASNRAIASLGIDVELVAPLPDDISPLVITLSDNPGTIGAGVAGRLIFAAKEAVFKAAYALDGALLDYDDIDLDLDTSLARTRTGHAAKLFWCLDPRIVVLAMIPGGDV